LEPRFFSFFFDHAKKESKISWGTLLYREVELKNAIKKIDVMGN